MARLIVVGLDGGEWTVLRAAFEQERLPVLRELASAGGSGPLRSTHPPLTPAAWTSFFTGVDPARHGVMGFVVPEPGRYTTRPTSAADRRHPTLFARLASAGHRVATVTVPWTYPPEEFPGGCQIGGSGVPASRSDTVSPAGMWHDVERAGGIPFPPTLPTRDNVLGRALENQAVRFRLAELAFDRFDPDVLMLVVQETDLVPHFTWGSEAVPAEVLDLYEEIDRRLGLFLAEAAGPDDAVLVVSDHGAGPCRGRVQLNRVLADLGFLAAAGSPRPLGARRALRGARRIARKRLSAERRRRLRWAVPAGVMSRLSGYLHHAGVDWSRTVAYSILEYGGVHINVSGRQPHGIVAPEDAERVRAEVKEALEQVRAPDGRPLFSRVWKREELHEGPFVDEAPDLVCDATDPGWGIYGWWDLSLPPFMEPGLRGVEDANRIGMHRPHGVWMLKDPRAANLSHSEEADIRDVLPAVVSGRGLLPLESALADRWYGPRPGASEPIAVESGERGERLSAEDAAGIERQLRDLGYLE